MKTGFYWVISRPTLSRHEHRNATAATGPTAPARAVLAAPASAAYPSEDTPAATNAQFSGRCYHEGWEMGVAGGGVDLAAAVTLVSGNRL